VTKKFTPLIRHLLVAKNSATGHIISKQILWWNLNLPLLAIQFVKKLVWSHLYGLFFEIKLISVISAKYYFIIGSIFSRPATQHQQASRSVLRVAKVLFVSVSVSQSVEQENQNNPAEHTVMNARLVVAHVMEREKMNYGLRFPKYGPSRVRSIVTTTQF